MLRRHELPGGTSWEGNCWDNAVVESFFATLKTERVHETKWAMRDEAKTAIVQWIEGWYNRERIHTSLNNLCPVEFEKTRQRETIERHVNGSGGRSFPILHEERPEVVSTMTLSPDVVRIVGLQALL